MRPVHTESTAYLFDLTATLRSRQQNKRVHHCTLEDMREAITAPHAQGFLPTSQERARKKRSLQRRQWPESTGPEFLWRRWDCVPLHLKLSCRLNPPRGLRPEPLDLRVSSRP